MKSNIEEIIISVLFLTICYRQNKALVNDPFWDITCRPITMISDISKIKNVKTFDRRVDVLLDLNTNKLSLKLQTLRLDMVLNKEFLGKGRNVIFLIQLMYLKI